ncbi:aldo/keto reductase [Natronoglycomyces albus]|uniref:Aldo/keto reductase n=1 Tax=Natronoglycomyces albus TaxID=2811108 RepID=A0A895XTR8_9ACTN|nr:aldo/keto reductase [Natronoglycomyces albus]QSB06715.1 aldo/keto reductase [Natronoglycomyces albus]
MERRPLGRSGIEVSRLGLGTMTWSTDEASIEDAAAQLQLFADAGGTLVDTADVFGQGAAEAALGQLIDRVVPRRDLHIASKAGVRTDGSDRRRDTSRIWLMRSLDATLKRLNTDYIDIWNLHVYDPDTPLEETLSTLDWAVETGRVRYIGVSNFTGWQTARAAAWQNAWPTRTALSCTQVEYSLLQRGVEREVLPACLAMELGVLAWSPLGRGVLSGKYRYGRPSDSRAASAQWSRFVTTYLDERSAGIVEAVATAADGLGVSPLEVALAWVRDQPGVASAIVGARNASQLRASLATDRLFLPPEIRLALDDVSAPDVGYPESY